MSGVIWIIISLALGAIVHEAGHFACAAAGSISVKLVAVGVGPVVLRSRLGKTEFELRALPLTGFTAPVTYNNIRKPWVVLCVLGGALGNCTLIGLVALLDHVSGPSTLPQFVRDGFGPLVFVNAAYVLVNLLPVRGNAGGRRIASDGLQIIQLLRGRHTADAYPIYRMMLQRYCPGTDPQSSASYRQIVRQLARGDVWTNEFTRRDVLDAIQRELAGAALRPEEEMHVLDSLITVGLVSGDPQFRSHLDRWSQRACELGPEITTLKGSRGAMLVELGQFEAGRALLQELTVANRRPCDRLRDGRKYSWPGRNRGSAVTRRRRRSCRRHERRSMPIQRWLSSGR
jgi:hypothetical protein